MEEFILMLMVQLITMNMVLIHKLTKKFMEDRLKFTGSVRYDKSKNFEGNFSPRVSLVYSAGERKNHNFRGSFQTGFRNPTTQDQYIGFNVGNAVLIGSAPDNLTRFTETLPISANGQVFTGGNVYSYNEWFKMHIIIHILHLISLEHLHADRKSCLCY